jgi:hypothetical protein
VGLGIIAGEVLQVARLLDRGEVKLREVLQRSKGVWEKSSSGVRALIVLTIILCVVTLVYGALRLFSLSSLVS